MSSHTSSTAQIASAVKTTLDNFSITRVSQTPTILSIKQLKVELCNMAAAVESNMTGGKYGHMYLILNEAEYRMATSNTTATVDKLLKPDDVNPLFRTEKKEDLTRYRVMQLENETKMSIIAYITQEEVSKEITRRMVESIDLEFIEELKSEYTGFTNETPKSLIAHVEKEYCEPTIDDKLKALKEFEAPWDQVVPIGTWITRLEKLKQKCAEAGVTIDDERMVLTITANAMKCPLFTQIDHEGYDDIRTKDLTTVTTYWVKKYKAHKKFNRDQSATNEYESAAFTMVSPPPSEVPPDYDTYVSALEDVIARQLVDREDALTINTAATTATTSTASMANLMAEVTRLTTLVTTMAAANGGGGGGGAGGGGGDSGAGGGGGGGGRRRKYQYGKDKNGNDLPKCPNCNKPATHKAEECFSLPKNEEKKKAAGFVDGKFTKKKEE